ncbi:MAG: response regulator, partial [Blastocatellia bacterium]|nr:response regulator [Blastocatellia bacterium]
MEAALRGEHLTLERPSHVTDSRDANDDVIYLRLDYVPDIDENGHVIGYFAFAVDLSETRRVQEALRKSEEQLMQAQKLESIGRLAGGIAHDFNNMLTAITGYSDLALRRMKADDPLRHHIEEIMKAGKRSAELTNQLLAFSRRQMLQPQIIDVNDVIEDTLVMLRRLIGEHIELSVQLGDGLSPVSVDPGQLSQILVNLIINSRDAMPDGGSILIETGDRSFDVPYTSENHNTPPGEYVMIAVSDNGLGMDEETKTQMFEPFFTTKEVGKGTGLGLSTVYGVVKQSGGNISVYTEPEHGTTIKIYLPRVESSPNAEVVVTQPNELRFGTETILLVEDEDVVRNLSREVLQTCGYTVIEAANGVEALEVFKRTPQRIDMLMTDVVMPQMGGSDLAKKILELQPNIKILFTSGYTDSAAVRNGVLEKGSSFIAKPFTFGQLASKLKEMFTSE